MDIGLDIVAGRVPLGGTCRHDKQESAQSGCRFLLASFCAHRCDSPPLPAALENAPPVRCFLRHLGLPLRARSQEPREVSSQEKTSGNENGDKLKASMRSEGQVGNPAFIREILDCIIIPSICEIGGIAIRNSRRAAYAKRAPSSPWGRNLRSRDAGTLQVELPTPLR